MREAAATEGVYDVPSNNHIIATNWKPPNGCISFVWEQVKAHTRNSKTGNRLACRKDSAMIMSADLVKIGSRRFSV